MTMPWIHPRGKCDSYKSLAEDLQSNRMPTALSVADRSLSTASSRASAASPGKEIVALFPLQPPKA